MQTCSGWGPSEHRSGPAEPAHATGSARDRELDCVDVVISSVVDSPAARYSCCKERK